MAMSNRRTKNLVTTIVAMLMSGGLMGCGVIAVQPAHAINPSDAGATHTYIRARYSLEGVFGHSLSRVDRVVDGFVIANTEQCRGIMRVAPRDRVSSELTLTARLIPVVIAARLNREPIVRFDHTVARIGWTNPRLTQLVRDVANQEAAISNIVLPNLCGAIKAWARSGYRTAPLAITRFLRASRVMAISNGTSEEVSIGHVKVTHCMHVGPPSPRLGDNLVCTVVKPGEEPRGDGPSATESGGAAIWSLLKKYETGGELTMAQRAEGLEANVTAQLSALFTGAYHEFSSAWDLS